MFDLLEGDGVLVVDISLGEVSVSLPGPLLVLVKLEESHLDVSLLHTLDEDENFVAARHTAGECADSAYLPV